MFFIWQKTSICNSFIVCSMIIIFGNSIKALLFTIYVQCWTVLISVMTEQEYYKTFMQRHHYSLVFAHFIWIFDYLDMAIISSINLLYRVPP